MKMLFTILLVIFNIAYAYAITVNVKDQGAKGDGVTDDTRAFDRSVEMVCERGGVLFVPNGNYRLNGLTRRRSGVNGNGYIFLMLNSLEWRMEKDAILLFENNFQGFRFRSLTDPNAKTITKLSLIINGGKVLGRDIKSKGKGNPEKWAFVGEYLKSMSVQNLEIENLFASAGVASYHNDFVSVINCKLKNVTGNSGDLMDNHGDGIYIGWTSKYLIKGNSVLNDVTTRRLGRIGICIEYEKSKNGTVEKNTISGYDRGVHVELITGTSQVLSNIIEGCVSGIVLWNNYGQPQIIRSNKISNKNLTSKVNPILYTSAPILLIGYNSNNGSIIENNIITVTKIERNSYMPKQLLSITSSNVKLLNNIFVDSSQSLRAFIGQGKSSNEIVTNIEFSGNQLQCLEFITSDAEALTVQNNKFVSKFGAFLFKDKATGSSSKKISKSVIKNNVFAVEKSLNVNGDTIDRTLNKFIK